ncbi:hypothetical protein [Phenylobacterium sp. J367]|uniref:hypothetical protein n=1 Tax=Phenylobacterium sp. J367 TaxID=2898435 RepID=UPI0021511ABD|nr:hypothetical protein [Phenylobacterium sp. J367]MCR5880640.1 hypothetical protein [Phenylobacterium sp. J367]
MRGRIFTTMAAAGLALAGCGQAPEPEAPPPLPEGRVQLIASGVTESRFLALDDLKAADGLAQATVLIVGATGTSIGKTYAMALKRETIDCAAGRTTAETQAYYDATGKLMHQEVINTGRMGRPLEPAEVEANVACGTASAGRVFRGWRSAQREVQAPPEAVKASAAQDDVNIQAWLCAATVRGRLKPPQPEACDRAVALAPSDPNLRLDHGYVSLVSNELATAKADFDAVIATDPDNAAAYFGRSLIPAIRGAPSAGAADLAKARALDPKVSQAVEATYKVQVGDAYR